MPIVSAFRSKIKEEFKLHHDMSRPPEQYTHKPNLWRVACELSKFKDPYTQSPCY